VPELDSTSPLLLHGDVPSGWAPKRLGGIADISGGTTPSRKESSYWGGKIPWATPTDITSRPAGVLTIERTAEGLDDIAIEETSVRVLPVGTVLMTSRATIGEVAINTVPMATNQGFCNFVPKQETDPKFLAYWLAGNRRRLVRLAGGSTFLELAKRDARRVRIHLPPLPEQRKIAAILSSIDDAIAATRRVIEQTKRVKQGLLQTLMTRGIGHTRFKKTEIGAIPEEWEVVRLEDCCEVLDRHRVPLNSEERRERQGDIPYWGANGIVDHIDDYIFDEPLVLIAEDGGYFDQASERPIAQLVEGKIWVNNHAHVLRVTDQVSREWFYFWFVHRDITPFINSGTRSKLNQRDLRQLPIAVPGSDEQDRVVTLLQSVAGVEVVLAREVDCLTQLKRGLMQVLLTGRVRVQPD
jgi:type I restriction enzyme S subunit